ncbi:MAG: nucleotidyltransferase family protein [Myxococcales bacterium]|nr:nucleotidyltransferase family protein [Myxococcales bacterium]
MSTLSKTPGTASVHESSGPVAALILAAGGSTRMGTPKALLPWGDTTLLGHCIEVALASTCDEVWVAVGADEEAVENAICDPGVQRIRHEQWRAGMGSTIAVAVGQLSQRLGGVMILPCDQPFVTPELLDSLLERRIADGTELAACRYRDTVGPPAFFPRSAFERLASLTGDRGAKALLIENLERVALVDFPLGAFDIDTPEDYDRALDELARRKDR